MKILLIAHFCDEVGLGGNNRFNYLSALLAAQGYQVELMTSGFSHTTKQPKQVQPSAVTDFKLTYIDEPSYTRNVSLRRFWAHRKMATNLARALRERTLIADPDLVYCAVPSLAVAEAASEYATRIGKPLVIDVQDLWPDAFFMVGPLRKCTWLFEPLQAQARRIYARADGVVAVSQRYLDRAVAATTTNRPQQVMYLGTDLQRFDAYAAGARQRPASACITFVYLGTLGHSYDLKTAISAFKRAQQTVANTGAKRETPQLRLLVIGDGPLQQEFTAYAQQQDVAVDFVGRLPYAETVQRLVECDVALNVISQGAAQSIINKHADYAAAGLPVLSTQECAEYCELLRTYGAGISCVADEPNSTRVDQLAKAMVELAENTQLRRQLGRGSRQMAEALFDRRATYPQLIALLEATRQQHSQQPVKQQPVKQPQKERSA